GNASSHETSHSSRGRVSMVEKLMRAVHGLARLFGDVLFLTCSIPSISYPLRDGRHKRNRLFSTMPVTHHADYVREKHPKTTFPRNSLPITMFSRPSTLISRSSP
ncbi:unnamed protein product, partial [Sphacelaria rigidula]